MSEEVTLVEEVGVEDKASPGFLSTIEETKKEPGLDIAINHQDISLKNSAIYLQAKALVDSKLVPKEINTPEKCMIAMQYCMELGIPTFLGLSEIYIIGNKPSISGKAMAALIRKKGGKFRLVKDLEKFDTGEVYEEGKNKGKPIYDAVTEIEAKRPDEDWTHTIKFFWSEAAEAGYTTKPGDSWKKQPKVMMYWRCISKMARMVFSDFTMGLYLPEELDNTGLISLDEDGNVIDNRK